METTTMNPIEAAVMPLKVDAQDKAEQYALRLIERVKADLASVDWDVKKTAPYPDSRQGRFNFMAGLQRYHLFTALVVWRKSGIGMHDPCFVDMSPERCAQFVSEARQDAAAQYDRFVAKLNKKIGPVSGASLDGNHVWSISFLTVETPSGHQVWKTQTIINQSKLGKIFNQFPTRKITTL